MYISLTIKWFKNIFLLLWSGPAYKKQGKLIVKLPLRTVSQIVKLDEKVSGDGYSCQIKEKSRSIFTQV